MSETDWKVVRTDEHPVLDEKGCEIQRLREALEDIAYGDYCASGYSANMAVAVARAALEPSND